MIKSIIQYVSNKLQSLITKPISAINRQQLEMLNIDNEILQNEIEIELNELKKSHKPDYISLELLNKSKKLLEQDIKVILKVYHPNAKNEVKVENRVSNISNNTTNYTKEVLNNILSHQTRIVKPTDIERQSLLNYFLSDEKKVMKKIRGLYMLNKLNTNLKKSEIKILAEEEYKWWLYKLEKKIIADRKLFIIEVNKIYEIVYEILLSKERKKLKKQAKQLEKERQQALITNQLQFIKEVKEMYFNYSISLKEAKKQKRKEVKLKTSTLINQQSFIKEIKKIYVNYFNILQTLEKELKEKEKELKKEQLEKQLVRLSHPTIVRQKEVIEDAKILMKTYMSLMTSHKTQLKTLKKLNKQDKRKNKEEDFI